MKLWDRIQRGMNLGLDAALATVYTLTEKAGEGIEITLLRREKARCDAQLTKLLAKLGNTVYEKVSEKRLDDIAKQLGIKSAIEEIAREEAQIVDIDTRLGRELKKQERAEGAAEEAAEPADGEKD
jgi:hypothetical protein